jgi:hypothetical protein
MWEERKDTAREGDPKQRGERIAFFERRSFVLTRMEENRGEAKERETGG